MGWTRHAGARWLQAPILAVPVLYPGLGVPRVWGDTVMLPLIAAGAMVAAIGARDSWLLRTPLLVWPGLLSYSLYLWQTPIRPYGLGATGELPALPTLALTIAAAFMSWRSVEGPTRRVGRRVAERDRDPAAT